MRLTMTRIMIKTMKKTVINISSPSLKILAGSLLLLVSTVGMAATCLDVFPTVLSSSANNGKVKFEQEVRINGTNGEIDIRIDEDDTRGSALSCISQQCEDSGSRAEAFSLPDFQKSDSNEDEKADNGESLNLPQGSYDEVEAKDRASIRFTQNGQDTFIKKLKADNETTIIFDGGVYWIEKLDLKYKTNIVINGNDKVILMTEEKDFKNNEVSYNVNGTPDQLVIVAYDDVEFGYKTSLKGFIYADKKIELDNESDFEGAIHSEDDIKFKYKASINYARSNIESANFNGLCTVSPTSGLSGNLNVDNTFEAYLSTDDAVQGVFLSSGDDWQTTYTLLSQLTPGQDYYLHIKATNTGGPAGFLGDFEINATEHTFSNGLTTLTTNTTDWMVSTIGWNNYQTPNSYGANGASPWGTRSSVDANAQWIWSSDNNNDNATYFSTRIGVPPLTPLLDYRFDECSLNGVSGDIVDQTGNFNGGSNGIPAPIADGVINKSLDLSATDVSDWISVPTSVLDGIDDFSIAVWFKTSVTKTQQEILHALGRDTRDDELEIFLKESNSVYIKVRDDSEVLTSNIELTDGNWHHLVVTRVDEDVCLYIDGASQECDDGVNDGELSVNHANAIVIGQEQDSFGGNFSSEQSFVGQLDEFKIFDVKLSDTEIDNIYQNELAGNNYDASTRDAVQCANICYANAGELNAVGIRIGSGGSNTEINNTTEALAIYSAWLDAGSPASGAIANGAYDVAASGLSAVDRIDFGGSAHDFADTLPYPGADAGVTGEDFLVHTSGTISLPAGDYTIYVESDDGFSFVMDTLSGDNVSFNKFGSSSSGESNELRYEQPTGNSNTGGSFTLSQDSVFDVAAIFFERGGGDYLEISIANDIRGNSAPSGYEILRHGALGDKVKFGQCSPPAPLLEYHFDEISWRGNSEEVLDSSGNNYNGTAVGGITTATGKICNAAEIPNNNSASIFEAVDTGVDLDTVIGSSGTISLWYKGDSDWNSGTDKRLFDATDGNKYFFAEIGSDGRVKFFFEDGNDDDYQKTTDDALSVGAGVWKHLTFVWDLTNITAKIFVDGVEQSVSAGSNSDGGTTAFTGLDTLYFGDNRDTSYLTGESSASGLIDEALVFDSVLTTTQIQDIFTNQDAGNNYDGTARVCLANPLDHFEILHDGNGFTCEPETVTIKACANEDCSIPYTDTISITLSPSGWDGGDTITFGNAQGEITTTLSVTDETTITLVKLGASPDADLRCYIGSAANCDLTFSNDGFEIYGANIGDALPDQLAANNFQNVNVRAVRRNNNVCEALLQGPQNINLTYDCDLPDQCLT
jgi:hypothetical protein